MSSKPPLIMGIVNITPDSFSDGGRFLATDQALAHGLQLAAEGAGVLDVGGESTRPGAQPVPVDEELRRVIPVIKAFASSTATPISIDTRKPAVARAAFEAGATIWNDVSALSFGAESMDTATSLGGKIILMHAQGDPRTMQDAPYYDDVVEDVIAYLKGRVEACITAGIAKDRLIVDPGIGFGKTLAHNQALFAGLARFHEIGVPILVGASRKRFISGLDDGAQATSLPNANSSGMAAPLAQDRLGGSIAAALAAVDAGADIIRVHDVAATRQAIAVWRGIRPSL